MAASFEERQRRMQEKDGLISVAFWQLMAFLMLILLIWANEVLDLTSLWFAAPESEMNIFRGCVLTIGVILVAIITVGHTYVQQKRIITGLLTVCSSCRKIRVDDHLWEQLDEYVCDHSLALISHGLCPECYQDMKREVEAMERVMNKPVQGAVSPMPK
jgi:uncharacterized membrane protein (DUF485 family)